MIPGSNSGLLSVGAGYQIDQSIRFNDVDSARLARTVSSSGSLTTWTLSGWIKRGKYTVNTNAQWFPVFSASAGSTTYDAPFNFNDVSTGGAFNVTIGGYDWRTSALARDTSAWYHVVIVWDSTNGTASDRMRLYINGERVTDFSSSASPSSAANSRWNSSSYSHHRIGNLNYSGGETTYVFDGYLSEINFIDGTALDPTSFGETNSNGVWVPIAYTGSYGTNGFYITGADSADLGADDSGNGNDFTSSGLTSADQMLDTPTDNYATFNVIRTGQTGITLTDGALQASAGSAGTRAVAANIPIDSETTTGYYAEIKITALAFASPSFFGLVTPEFVIGAAAMYASSGAYVYNDSAGATYANGVAGATYTPIVLNDVVQFAVKNGNVYVGINNTWVNSGDPVAETGAVWTGLSGLYSFCWEYHRGGGGTNTHTVVADFGQSGFAYTPPTGYSGVSTANLPAPAIKDGSAYFQTTLYTGNGSTLAVDQAGNSTFQPDLVWIKNRVVGATNHRLFDAVRGATKALYSSGTFAEATESGVTSFDADGFTLGSQSDSNGSGEGTVAWQWKANGSGSSNTDGSINTTATSANTTAGFSISTYTGTGSAATIGHGLGIAPKMVIVKKRVAGTDDAWVVWHASLPGANYYLNLNDNGAQDTSVNYWNNTLPTSSVFSVGASNGTNENTKTFVAYCFAEVEGFSKFGSYTGNGSADGPFINCGFRPAFVMFKKISATGSWAIYDSGRSLGNPTGQYLYADKTDAEGGAAYLATYALDFVSNGMKLRSATSNFNDAATYIFAAFAEFPFKTANAR